MVAVTMILQRRRIPGGDTRCEQNNLRQRGRKSCEKEENKMSVLRRGRKSPQKKMSRGNIARGKNFTADKLSAGHVSAGDSPRAQSVDRLAFFRGQTCFFKKNKLFIYFLNFTKHHSQLMTTEYLVMTSFELDRVSI